MEDQKRRAIVSKSRCWDGAHWREQEENLVEELPVSVLINGVTYAVMLATPHDLQDFAWGFLWTEAVLFAREEVLALEMESTSEGVAIFLQLTAEAAARAEKQRRKLPGASACGLCGRPDFSGLQPFTPLSPPQSPPDLERIRATMAELVAQQCFHHENGNTHAAALRFRSGRILVREDIGRHNAVDKVIGAALMLGELPGSADVLAVSSRLPFEIVRKALSWRIPLVAAISGISSMALQIAQQNHVQLVGFVREGRCTVYCDSSSDSRA
ncbi:formate dehydrogenase accessory sulfurtransferase FdhD [Acidithiobacillus sp. IBUN Pt1247-S3]|uniref:formate dehydrogenase accessory sulfurtransferase FdhD n=1 Tax=Acidithiobacillus sp. IBUN Pt1247-S3 TaxID=3166642 RepID=UPI0034E5C188